MKKAAVFVLFLLAIIFLFMACVDIDEALPHYNIPNCTNQTQLK